MRKFLSAPLIAAAFLMTFTAAPSLAANDTVKVTPIGSHDGEFCRRDRALIFEDPNGTRILFDAGRTVRGSGDPRLNPGIDVVLLSSVHGDHIGDRIEAAQVANPGNCNTAIDITPTTPDSNTAEIVAGTGAMVFSGGEMRDFLRAKVADAGGSASQIDVLRPGGTRVFNDVEIAVVMAIHSNGVDRSFLTVPLKNDLAADGLTAYVGPDHGYIIKFTNGLVVYMTADTGQTSDMKLIVHDFYKPQLAVVNMGGIFSMGPKEAAFAVNNLIKPKSVIASHANQATTIGGVVQGGTKTAEFIGLVDAKISVHVPLSNVTLEFNGQGKCVAVTC
ncbi:MAG: MBL fold metallo-hydrolase [Nitrospiraceae bacterium]